jgi:hypothetical protein
MQTYNLNGIIFKNIDEKIRWYMSKKRRKKRQDFKDILIIVLLFVSVIAIALNVWNMRKKDDSLSNVATNDLEIQEEVVKNPDSIAIPGYEGITLKANSLEQNVSFNNPPQNCCYFVMTLCLEDGTILWESDYIEPGKVSEPIVLTQELKAGTYSNAVLKYSCYSVEDESQLNGAETKLTLWVN